MNKKIYYVLIAIAVWLVFIPSAPLLAGSSNAIDARIQSEQQAGTDDSSSSQIQRRRIGKSGEIISDREERKYELERQKKEGQITSAKDTAAGVPPVADAWKYQLIKVDTALEKKYDVNNKGWLDPGETRQMLRDKYEQIKASGTALVDSAVERQYDTNNDGVLDAGEAEEMNKDLQ